MRPLPFSEARQLVRVWETYGTPGNFQPVSYPNFEHWRSWNRTFAGLSAFTGSTAVLTGWGEPRRLTGVIASANLLELLRVQPVLGRRFLPEEDQSHANRGVDSLIIGDRLWREAFAGSREILGRVVTLNGKPYWIVGVMPPGVDIGAGPADPISG